MTIETRPAPPPVEPAPARPKTVREVLLHAALLIDERGWFGTPAALDDGRLCAWLAIDRAAGRDDFAGAMMTFYDFIGGGSIISWNDTPGRTAAEVVAALRAAAESA